MPEIPREKSPESSLFLLLDGYNFISKRSQRFKSDVFQTRFLFQKAICLIGEEAAHLFYDNEKFVRTGANPKMLLKTLLGETGVQTKDGLTHRFRKVMFMSLMTPESIQKLVDLTAEQWESYLAKWEKMERVVLYPEVQEILCRAVCAWSGVPLEEGEVKKRTSQLGAMFEGAGSVGPRHIAGRLGRRSSEKWTGDLIEKVRAGQLKVEEGSALHTVAWYREPNGDLLDKKTAAVELLNILRPTVAVSIFITFVAHALNQYPQYRQQLQAAGNDQLVEWFAQEVRRFYPFFPFVAARAQTDFEWKGYRFPKGTRVFLDLYGTDHDKRLWNNPQEFRPGRFGEWQENAFDFIPQGGGDYYSGHRCPGERITIELMKLSVDFLTRSMSYYLPEQDLTISLSRIPALPKSRFIMKNVRQRAD